MEKEVCKKNKISMVKCKKHPNEFLIWVCLDQKCIEKLFCQYCIILDHIKIHQNYIELDSFLKDPLVKLTNLNEGPNSISDKLEEKVKNEINILEDLMQNSTFNLNQKFQQMKRIFAGDLDEYFKNKSNSIDLFDKKRSDFKNLLQNDLLEQNQSYDQLKKIVDDVFEKYSNDKESENLLEDTLQCIPKIIFKDYNININNCDINKFSWRKFANKGIKSYFIQIFCIINYHIKFIFSISFFNIFVIYFS